MLNWQSVRGLNGVKGRSGCIWNVGDVIWVVDNVVVNITDFEGNIIKDKIVRLKSNRFYSIDDIRLKLVGEWELITDEPHSSVSLL